MFCILELIRNPTTNLLKEVTNLLKVYSLTFDDIKIIINGKVEDPSKLDIYYENDYGRGEVKDIQLIIDELTWFERTSYNGWENLF